MAEIKFTDEELNRIQAIQNDYSEVITKSGRLFVTRVTIEEQLAEIDNTLRELKTRLTAIREAERLLANELNAKYGDGELNPQTGIFTPKPTA